uniref:zinc ribbon domain-containing protein n=1 Tax=Prevotella sp. TaxID=59823 RepID=UPI0025CBFBEF|nr:zinc ribbon domain-containing protein [uncultured Prevotella sp.]
MAIIKCPECGRQISDKAPTCPSCGVEIAGKTTKCPNCGEVYFNYLEMCPNCQTPNPTLVGGRGGITPTPSAPGQSIDQVAPVQQSARRTMQQTERPGMPATPPPPPVRPTTNNGNGGEQNPEKKEPEKKMSVRSILIISLIFSVLVCGILYYFYDNANKNKEMEAYEYAMQSSDPMVLQSYLDTYKDADEAHRDSITAHLEQLKQNDQDWTNAVVSGSKDALQAYLQKYPNSIHKQEVINKIDSIDWNVAKNADTADAYQTYLDAHRDGSHIEEAENALKKVKGRDLQPEEKEYITGLYRQFFQSINSRDGDGLLANCEDILSSLLGKNSAPKSDIVTFMNKLYKEDVANMNWHINNDYQIKKREIGDSEYEYQVVFTAKQAVDKTDGSKHEQLFKISSTVSPDLKISSFNMSKVNTGE